MNWNRQALNSRYLIWKTLEYPLTLARQYGDIPRITNIVLDQLYVVVALDNGNQGVALNYQNSLSTYRMDHTTYRSFANYLLEQAKTDPLLSNTLLQTERGETLCEASLAVAISSAVAQSYLIDECLNYAGLVSQNDAIPLTSLVQDGDTVTVIGFGGYLLQAVNEPRVKRLIVADLKVSHPVTAARLRERVASWKPQLARRSFELHDGLHSDDLIRKSQIACITGSALCNGTLNQLLDAAHNCRTVIIQGHSAGVYPLALLQRGVHYVVQSVIETDILRIAQTYDQSSVDFGQAIDRLIPQKRTISQKMGEN